MEQALGQVFARIDAPVLTDIRIVQSPVRFLDRVPAELPDLFSGEELVVFARYQGEASGEIILEGSRNGRRERFSAPVRFPEHETANAWVAPLWASQRIGELTRQARIEGASPGAGQPRSASSDSATASSPSTPRTWSRSRGSRCSRGDRQGRLEQVPRSTRRRAQSGADAVRRADKSAKLAEAKNLAAAEDAANLDLREKEGAAKSKRVGGKALRRARRGLDGRGPLRYRAGRGCRPLQSRLVRAHPCPARNRAVAFRRGFRADRGQAREHPG